MNTQEPGNNQNLSQNVGIALVIVLVAVGVAFYILRDSDTDIFNSFRISQRDEVIARVNGKAIMRSELDGPLEGVERQRGEPLGDEEEEIIKDILESLIIEELLVQKAEEEGVSVDESDAVSQVEDMKSMLGEEDFASSLEDAGVTEKEVIHMFQRMLTIQALFNKVFPLEDIEVTEEEVRALFDMLYGEESDEETFEDVRGDLKLEIQYDKQNNLIDQYVLRLREESSVEVLL